MKTANRPHSILPDVPLLQGRLCAWCRHPIPETARADARACSVACRKPLSRFRKAVGVAPSRVDVSARTFAFAELPDERRHEGATTARALHVGTSGLTVLLHEIEASESWAIALPARHVEAALHQRPRARVGFIHRPGSIGPADAVVFGGQTPATQEVPSLRLHTRHLARQQATMHKPAQFWRWVFETLDVRQGDQFSDVYPGASGGRQAFEIYTLTTEGQRP